LDIIATHLLIDISVALKVSSLDVVWTWIKLAAMRNVWDETSYQVGFNGFRFGFALVLNELRESIPHLGNLLNVLFQNLLL
jgi:hypothetical protein